MLFGDQLSDRQIYTAIQANGTVKDIGGAVQYYNMRRRWNFGVGLSHVPYLTGYVYLADTTLRGSGGSSVQGYTVNYLLQRLYFDQAAFFAQYPFSSTQRFEFSASAAHLGFDNQLLQSVYIGNTLVDQVQSNQASQYKGQSTFEPSFSLVGDNSFGAFTSPVAGGRYRLSVTPTFGSLLYQTALVDYRKYIFMRPFSLAFRGYHLGRYGRDAENGQVLLPPLYLGEETWIRGYGWGSFTSDECANATNNTSCPAFERLWGSRVMGANAEFRRWEGQ